MRKKTISWYAGAVVAWALALSITTCILSLIIKLTLIFLTWLF